MIVEINEYSYDCGDGCCTNYGTVVTIDGKKLECHNQDLPTQIEQILKHLGYEPKVIYKYNGEEI